LQILLLGKLRSYQLSAPKLLLALLAKFILDIDVLAEDDWVDNAFY